MRLHRPARRIPEGCNIAAILRSINELKANVDKGHKPGYPGIGSGPRPETPAIKAARDNYACSGAACSLWRVHAGSGVGTTGRFRGLEQLSGSA